MSHDEAISVFRYFKWDAEKMQNEWYDDETKLKKKLGLEYD